MSGDWSQYFEYKQRRYTASNINNRYRYEYKDKSVKTLPANLPMPPVVTLDELFNGCKELQDISALANWDVSKVESMQWMFYDCKQLQDITPLANWDTSNVNDMSCMFYNCNQLKDITALANWNNYKDEQSKCKNMQYMFWECYQLKNIAALANWNVSGCDIYNMFEGCSSFFDAQAVGTNWVKQYRYSWFDDIKNIPNYRYTDSYERANILSRLRSLPEWDNTQLLNSLWERVKPLLKDTTKLNGYFKRYAIKVPIETPNSTPIEAEPIKEPFKEPIKAPNHKAILLDLPSDWQNIELPQWNP